METAWTKMHSPSVQLGHPQILLNKARSERWWKIFGGLLHFHIGLTGYRTIELTD